MSEQATEAKSVERKKAGRPPSIDLDDLRNAIDRIEASGKLASAGAVLTCPLPAVPVEWK